MEFVRVYPIGLLAPRAARHSLDLLIGLVRPAPLMDLRVIVSEFVTNSVRHAGQHDGDPIMVRVDCTEARVRIEVEDGGPGFTPVFPRPETVDGGSTWWTDWPIDGEPDRVVACGPRSTSRLSPGDPSRRIDASFPRTIAGWPDRRSSAPFPNPRSPRRTSPRRSA